MNILILVEIFIYSEENTELHSPQLTKKIYICMNLPESPILTMFAVYVVYYSASILSVLLPVHGN